MIAFQPIFFTTGLFLSVLSGLMFIPAFVDYYYSAPSWQSFLVAAFITGVIGLGLTFANRPHDKISLTIRETFVLTAATWIAVSIFAALPFILATSGNQITDAYFEAVSGLTATGATILSQLSTMPPGILLWRSLLQSLGGIGIIVMAITIMPILKIGGMQLFHSEFSDRSEKIMPRVSQIATSIVLTYIFLILLCTGFLYVAGMTFLEALCHGMATVSTGGFSTSDLSVGYFNSYTIEVIIVVFMIASSITLILWVRTFQGNPFAIFKDDQVKGFILILGFAILTTAFWRASHGTPFAQAFRESLFNVTSIMTTSGFATSDYNFWGMYPLMLLFILMMIGGCTGSTTGGPKVFRYQIMVRAALTHMKKLRRPQGIFIPKFNDARISGDIFSSVMAYFAIYFMSLAAVWLGISLFNYDFLTSLSAAIACMNNIGPGMGPIIGPLGNYQSLDDGAKWILMGGMLLGRIEYITFLILFIPNFWRD